MSGVDIHTLARRADELSRLSPQGRMAHQEEALDVNNAITRAASPAAITRAMAELEARFGSQIRAQGQAALRDPWWLLRRDDGQPPVLAILVESALARAARAPQRATSTVELLGQWRQLQQRRAQTGVEQLRREVRQLLDQFRPQEADADAFLKAAPVGWQQRLELLLGADPLVPNLIRQRGRDHA